MKDFNDSTVDFALLLYYGHTDAVIKAKVLAKQFVALDSGCVGHKFKQN